MKKLLKKLLLIAMASAFASGLGRAQAETLAELGGRTHYHEIAFSRAGTAALLLASHHGLFAVAKDGTVQRISPVHDFMGFSPDPINPLSYFASGHPTEGGNSGLLQTLDGGATWKKLSAGVDGPVDFHQMAVSGADPAIIYGSFHGIQMSSDRGLTWKKTGETPTGLIALTASSKNPNRIYGATKNGLLLSDNSGGTWSLSGFQDEAVSMVEDGSNGSLYVFVVGRGLMKSSEDGPANGVVLNNNFGEAFPLHFAVDPNQPLHLVLSTQNNDVLESRDGGKTWLPFGT